MTAETEGAAPDANKNATPVEGAAEAAVPADATYFCVDCTQPIIGAMYGAGDGSGQRFRHPECHWRDAAHAYEMDMLDAKHEADALREFIEGRGYRRCDIPACNCGEWHGGHAEHRLTEIREALETASVDLNGRTILTAVRDLLERASSAPAENETRGAVADPEALRGALRQADKTVSELHDLLTQRYKDEAPHAVIWYLHDILRAALSGASSPGARQDDAEIAAWREDLDAVRAWAPTCDGVTLLAMLEHRLTIRTRAEGR